ncbi:MAG: hypothetical protein AB7I38_11920 [Dehalococcoidia bacterium]
MQRLGRPRVAGVAGGVGTTTIAVALHAEDGRVWRGDVAVHVLVCRSTMTSLASAQAAAAAAAARGSTAVLAVVGDGGSLTAPMRASLRMVDPYVAGVVHVPYVAGLRDLVRPWDAAADVLATGAPPRELRRFADALAGLADAVTAALVGGGGPARADVELRGRVSARPWPLAM